MGGSKDEGSSGLMKWFACGCGGCAGLLLLGLGAAALLFGGLFIGLRKTDAYADAVARARADHRVIEALGEPIDTGYFVNGSVNLSDDTGSAQLTIPISGPEGSAQIEVDAIKTDGQWKMRVLSVHIEATGEVIDLLEDGDAVGPDHEPDADPGLEVPETGLADVRGQGGLRPQPNRGAASTSGQG